MVYIIRKPVDFKFSFVAFFCFFLAISFLSGCASNRSLGQAALKNFETRTISADLNRVFSASTEALFDLGYTIKHSDKDAGIVVGERQDPQKSSKFWMGFFYGWGAAASVKPIVYNISILVKPKGEIISDVRIKTSVDGEPILDKKSIDQVWLYIDRQVLMESGPLENEN